MSAKAIADQAGLVEGRDYSLTLQFPFTDQIIVGVYSFFLNEYNTPAQRQERIKALTGQGGTLTHHGVEGLYAPGTSQAQGFDVTKFLPPIGNAGPAGGDGFMAGNPTTQQSTGSQSSSGATSGPAASGSGFIAGMTAKWKALPMSAKVGVGLLAVYLLFRKRINRMLGFGKRKKKG